MEGFIFLDNFKVADRANCFVAHLGKIKGKDDLFYQLKMNLQFPDYFGDNWDALNDCLADFCWIKEKNIVIVHAKLPILDSANLAIYIGILFKNIDGWNKWENGKLHQLKVVFPNHCRSEIEKLVEQAIGK